MYNDELYHSGVMGMHWGQRRYQNEDGSYKPGAEGRYYTPKYGHRDRRAAYKDLKQVIKETKGNYASDKFRNRASQHMRRALSQENINEINNAYKKWTELDNKSVNFYDTKFYKTEVHDKAYKDVYNTLEKEYPDLLNELIKANKGNKDTLDKYARFDALMDGAEDYYTEKARKKWNKTEEAHYEEQADKAHKEYNKLCEKAAKKILGQYGNRKISSVDATKYRQAVLYGLARL